TSPRATSMFTSSLASTPGNRLVIPRSSTALASGIAPLFDEGGTEPARGRTPGRFHVPRCTALTQLVRDHDRTALDLIGQIVELRCDVVDEPARRGISDAVVVQVEGLDAPLEIPFREGLDRVVRRDVHPLQVRREDERLLLGGRRQVLVGVRSDRPDV